MSDAISGAISDVLSTKRLKLVHPGAGKLTQMYATPEDVTSILAEVVSHRGQYRISSNNLALGAQSNFSMSTSAIIECPLLVFSIKAPDNGFFSHEGWGFDCVESIEVTYANSLMQNVIIRGDILKEYAKLCCHDKDERNQMLKAAGSLSNVAGDTRSAAVPLSFLNFNTSGSKGSWPIDASVLAGPIQVCVNWFSQAKSSRIFVDSDVAVTPADLPTAVIAAEITCATLTIQRAAFGVKDAMMRDRELVYSIPSRYVSIVNESRTVLNAITDEIQINLNSVPAGMLEAILIYAAPFDKAAGDNWVEGGTAKRKHGGSLRLQNARLEFGSQDILRYKNREEMLAFNRGGFCDTLSYNEKIILPGQAPGAVTYTEVESDIIVLPLVHNGNGVFNGHINEHVPSYGGSQLQLTLQFTDQAGETVTVGGPENGAAITSTSIQIWIGYYISSVLEVAQGTIDLQL